MSQPYTDQEIETAIEKIIRSAIRRPVGTLGHRSTGVTFDDFQEQTIAVMTLTPNAPFYVVKLGCGRMLDKVETLATTVQELNEATQAIGRTTTPVQSIAELSNANVAATALSLAGSNRTKSFKSMEAVQQALESDIALHKVASDTVRAILLAL